MKRVIVFLSAIALTLSVSAQDIKISGNRCIDVTLSFSYDKSGRYNNFEWTFGDGSTSTEVAPSHKYTEAGTYTVKLTASGTNAETANESLSVTINALPKIGFDIDSTEQRNAKAFAAKTSATNYTFEWDFGDGATASGASAKHAYSAPGTYTVVLTTSDDQKCTDTTSQAVLIEASKTLPNIIVPNSSVKENRYFMISCEEGSRLKLEIFNRWGYKMFSRTGTENIVWDGYNPQGTLVSPGTYFYVITVEEGTTNYDPLKGYITVYY